MKDRKNKKNKNKKNKKNKKREMLFLSWVWQEDKESWMNLLQMQERVIWDQITHIKAFI